MSRPRWPLIWAQGVMYAPVQAVQIEDLGDPNQGRDVVEAVVHKEKEPKVDLYARLAVTGDLMARAIVVLIVREGILGKWYRTPGYGLDGRKRAVSLHCPWFRSGGFRRGYDDLASPSTP